MNTTNLYNLIAVVAAIASATVATWHGAIDAGTYAAIVAGALGIGGIVHTNTATSTTPTTPTANSGGNPTA